MRFAGSAGCDFLLMANSSQFQFYSRPKSEALAGKRQLQVFWLWAGAFAVEKERINAPGNAMWGSIQTAPAHRRSITDASSAY